MNVVRPLLAGTLLMMAGISLAADAPSAPESGPGSAEYTHASMTRNSYGNGKTQYWIFEPSEPKPASAPVIVFMHGWSAMTPFGYLGWIEHIVRRGNIVIYPRYQESIAEPPKNFTPSAIYSIKSALEELQTGTHVKPDLTRAAVVGHSFGGVISANLAVLAAQNNLPAFKAVMCVEPGTGGFGVYEDYSKIPAKTLLLCVAGDEDLNVRNIDALRIFNQAKLDAEDKNFLEMVSDRHGTPPLIANHFAPAALPGIKGNALHWYGFWKWFDALTDAAFYGKNRKYALGDRPEQRFMGRWSDGTAVLEPKVTKGQ